MRANQRHPWTPERIEQLENAPAIRFAKLRPLAFEAVHLARKLIRQTWWKPPDDWLSPESIDAEVKLQCETQPPSADERLRLRGKIERERKKRKAAFEAASKSKQLDAENARDFLCQLLEAIDTPGKSGRPRGVKQTQGMAQTMHELINADSSLKATPSFHPDPDMHEKKLRSLQQTERRFSKRAYEALHAAYPSNVDRDFPDLLCPTFLTDGMIRQVFENSNTWPGVNFPKDIPALRKAALRHYERVKKSRLTRSRSPFDRAT